METWDKIRQMHHNEKKSIRQIARETGHARETVTKLVGQQKPPQYERKQPHHAPVLGAYKERLRERELAT